jgi:hypothetical protein
MLPSQNKGMTFQWPKRRVFINKIKERSKRIEDGKLMTTEAKADKILHNSFIKAI